MFLKKSAFILMFILLLNTVSYSLELGNTTEELNLSSSEMGKISLFLSNFSEIHMNYFNITTCDKNELLSFAMNHNYVNNKNSRVKNAGKIGEIIAIEDLEESVKKYFDINLKDYTEDSLAGMVFKDVPKGPIYYVKAKKVYEMSNGNIYIKGVLYDVKNKNITFGNVEAIAKKHSYKGKETYALIELEIIE